ncbi:MAG: hypothetical protein L6R42_006526 [Xanthoria sp. 1 TBL-2021]|nr:MAG: hypothetical protein L6R42_006526 [Xanthoria sp. 1 TBL-2021]
MEARNPLSEAMGAETHHPDTLHGSHLRHRLFPVLCLLLACDILRSRQGLLRGIRHCQFLCATVSLHCASSSQSERLLQEDQTETVGVAAQLACKMLRQPLENTAEWIDVVQYHLLWRVPILLRAGLHDRHSSNHRSSRALLPRIAPSGICAYLGTVLTRED